MEQVENGTKRNDLQHNLDKMELSERLEQVELSEQTEQVEHKKRTECASEQFYYRWNDWNKWNFRNKRNKWNDWDKWYARNMERNGTTFLRLKKKKNMNAKQINQKYQISDFLLLKGFKEKYVKENNFWYRSMIRVEESTPSFKVDTKLNLWYDHGIGVGGNLIDLACHIFKSDDMRRVIREVLETFSSFQPQNIVINKAKKESIKLIHIEELTEESLINYLQNRGLNKGICDRYCQQIGYLNADKYYKSIGFKNNSGGYELRGEGFKSCIAPKDISLIDNDYNKLSIFEGFMDFLSYLILPEFEVIDCNCLILNSLSLINQIDEILNRHTRTYLFLDNDTAGQNATNKLKKKFPCMVDMAIFYNNHKDLNDYLTSKNTEK